MEAFRNITSLVGKRFTIGSAVLISLMLTNAFPSKVVSDINESTLLDSVVLPDVLDGLIMSVVIAA